MPAPATLGQLRGNILDMEVGDYIIFKWRNTLNGFEATDDPTDGLEIPVNGLAYSSNFDNRFLYMVKVDRGLLIADRVSHHTVTFHDLNQNYFTRRKMNVSGVEGVIRMPTGGIAYANENGLLYIGKDLGFGAYPTINEWDTYIVNGNCNGKIIAGDDNVWHWNEGVASWTLNYPHTALKNAAGTADQGGSGYRIIRGKLNGDTVNPTVNRVGTIVPAHSSINVGLRLVFEYKEV